MNTFHAKVLCHDHPMTTLLLLLATLLTLFLLVPKLEAAAGDVPDCSPAAKKSSAVCPCKAGVEGAGCQCAQASKGCLHALKDCL